VTGAGSVAGFAWVALGGAIGSVARHAVGLALAPPLAGRFPVATFAVNCAGCLLIGLLAGMAARMPIPEHVRLFLMVGVLGGLTTFSAFGLESLVLLRRGDVAIAGAYMLGSVVVGVAAVWLGLRVVAAGAQG
jgi:CrcB protein